MKFSLFGINILHWAVAFLLSAILLFWIAFGQGYFKQDVTPVRVDFDPECDLRAGPCETVLEDGSRVSLGIQPRSIPVAKTLDLEVQISGISVDAITVDTNGVDMRMPPNRRKLIKSGTGHFQGQAGLMYCTRNAMEWEMLLELKTDKGQINVPYRFITVSDGSYFESANENTEVAE